MEITEKDIQRMFIRDCLNEHGDYLTDLFQGSIDDRELIKSEALLNSISENVDPQRQRLTISFLSYGRIQDLKSRNSIQYEAPDTNAIIWGIKPKKEVKKIRRKEWYAKNAYGSLNQLIGKLMYGLSDIERKRMIMLITNSEKLKQSQTTIKL